MTETVEKTNDLINNLTDELEPVKLLKSPIQRTIPWVAFAVLYTVFAIAVLGIRGDFSNKIHDAHYIFELSLVLLMSISAAACSIWMCIPDMRGQNWLLSTSLTLFAVVVAWITSQAFMDIDHMPHMQWSHCFEEAAVFGLLPAVTIVFLSMKGKTTHPNLMVLMNAIAVGGLGYIGLRITCASDDIAHICMFHILPYILIGGIIGAIGRKIYRW